ncbi:MAG: glutamate 5-kinase [Rhizobiaceae bacterium]
MEAALDPLRDQRRIVIKIGSALLVDRTDGLRQQWLESVAADISHLRERGCEVLVVSSGAIALGRSILALPRRSLRLEESQAAAACGQIELARAWAQALEKFNLKSGQILVTLGDTEERRRYLNARATISTLLKLGAVPVINENDTVATTEIRYGDNDRLAARVATMAGADMLILLSDIDGLYSAPPQRDPNATFIPRVEAITPEIEAMAGSAGTELSRGGMVTKIEAGKIATASGTAMIIASGKRLHPVKAISQGARATWFAPSGNPFTARKKWISGQLADGGALVIDDGALKALTSGKSLLPAGVRAVEGNFARGDIVALRLVSGSIAGRGIIAYDADDARRIAGCNSAAIAERLGYAGRSEMVHRDDLVLNETGKSAARE